MSSNRPKSPLKHNQHMDGIKKYNIDNVAIKLNPVALTKESTFNPNAESPYLGKPD